MAYRKMDRFLEAQSKAEDFGFLSMFFSFEEAETIAAAIAKNSALKYLSVPHCYMGARKLVLIVQALQENPLQRLTHLDLTDNRLEDNGVRLVTEFLRKNKVLKMLQLRSNRITGGVGSELLAEAIAVNTSLKKLELGRNYIGDEGMSKLDAALASNETLTELDLSENRFTVEAVRNMARLFRENKVLKKLWLQYNTIGVEGASLLAKYLQHNRTMEQLILFERYYRVLVIRGLLESMDEREVNLDVVLFPEDKGNVKIKSVISEWTKAKKSGSELIHIPREVFEYQDAAAIKTFMKAALADGLSANKAVKMLMVGRARAGKTSLTNSLVNDISGLTKDDDDRATVSVEIRPWIVDDVNISVWDFAGQEEYYMTHTFFLSRRCVVLLIVDLSTYKDFLSDVYYWVKALQTHVPGVSFFLVGTHIDSMSPEKVKEVCSEIVVSFHEEERRIVASLDKRLEVAEEEGATDMEHVRQQKDQRPQLLFDKVFPVSSAGAMPGVAELRQEVIQYATASEVAIKLPNSYVKLLKQLHAIAEAKPLEPIIERQSVRASLDVETQKSFEDEDDLDAAIELLHLVGQILWYRENDALSDRVFVSPRWVVDITKALIRHDMFKTEHGNPGVLYKLEKPSKIKDSEWSRMKKEFYKHGILDLRFLDLFDTWKEIDASHRPKLFELLKQFELVIELPKKKKAQNMKCLIPLYLKSSFHPEADAKRGTLRKSIAGLLGTRKGVPLDKHRVTWRYDLKEYFPEGLFFRILVRCFLLGKIQVLREHVMYAQVGEDVKAVIAEDRANSNITLTCSHAKDVQQLWPALVLFATEVEYLLRTAYRGVDVGVIAIAADNRLRERELCDHERHPDMVPPLAYMHVVWGHLSAGEVGLMLRLDNAEQQLGQVEEMEEGAEKESVRDLLAKDVFIVLERVLKNICLSNQLQVTKGRDFSAYLKAVQKAGAIEPRFQRKLAMIHEHYREKSSGKEHFQSKFVKRMIASGREILPKLPEIQISAQAKAAAAMEPGLKEKSVREKMKRELLEKNE